MGDEGHDDERPLTSHDPRTLEEPDHPRSRPALGRRDWALLGSLAEAEDAVQESYARWYATSRQQQEAIESPAAWLTTVASRICLDMIGSARVRRERNVGEWIPEPLPDRTEWFSGRAGGGRAEPADPADQVTWTSR